MSSGTDWKTLLEELAAKNAEAEAGGGPARQARQHRLGRFTARERIAAVVDAGSFVEWGRHVKTRHEDASPRMATQSAPGDGLVCGLASVDGRNVVIYAHDPTVLRGAVGREGSRKLTRLLDLALERRFPVISLTDSEGVRVEERTDALHSFGEIIGRTIRLKGKVPQITLVCGLCVGGAAYNAVLTDCVGMVADQSYMFVTGGKVTKVVQGSGDDIDVMGGPELHAKKTGAAHAVLADETAGFAWVKKVLAALTPRVPATDEVSRPTPEIEKWVSVEQRRAYDMRKVVASVFDNGSVFEMSEFFAPNLLTCFARLGGRAVAVVASQPQQLAGCLDIDASRKGAAFVEWATAAKLPVCTLVDVPGYLPGKEQEAAGILTHGSTLLTAYGQASGQVPLLCLLLRKSYGGASVLSFAADVRLALPTARVDIMGPDAAVEVVLGPAMADATPAEAAARAEAQAAFFAQRDSAWMPADEGYLDQVIAPAQVRQQLALALARLEARP